MNDYPGDDEDKKNEQESNNRAIGGAWLAIGIGVGVAVGASIDNIGAGIAIGAAIGVVMMVAQNGRSKRK